MKDYFKARSGANAASLGFQDQEVVALRKMGYTGTLNDMRRDFYQRITGIDWLTEARIKSKNFSPVSYIKNYAGKANGDGDLSRLMFYGAGGVEFAPNGFVNEPVSAYAGAAAENDESVAYFEVTTTADAYVQFGFRFNLNEYGSREDVLKMLKSLKFRIKTYDATVKVWDGDSYDFENVKTVGAGMQFVELDVVDRLEDVIDENNEVFFYVRTNTKSDGVNPLRFEFDYVELVPTFFKNMI